MSDWSPEPWEVPDMQQCCDCFGDAPYSEDEGEATPSEFRICECECHQ